MNIFLFYWLYKNYICIYFRFISNVIFNNFLKSKNKHVSNACRKNYFRVTLINSAKPDEKILFKMKYMKR